MRGEDYAIVGLMLLLFGGGVAWYVSRRDESGSSGPAADNQQPVTDGVPASSPSQPSQPSQPQPSSYEGTFSGEASGEASGSFDLGGLFGEAGGSASLPGLAAGSMYGELVTGSDNPLNQAVGTAALGIGLPPGLGDAAESLFSGDLEGAFTGSIDAFADVGGFIGDVGSEIGGVAEDAWDATLGHLF